MGASVTLKLRGAPCHPYRAMPRLSARPFDGRRAPEPVDGLALATTLAQSIEGPNLQTKADGRRPSLCRVLAQCVRRVIFRLQGAGRTEACMTPAHRS